MKTETFHSTLQTSNTKFTKSTLALIPVLLIIFIFAFTGKSWGQLVNSNDAGNTEHFEQLTSSSYLSSIALYTGTWTSSATSAFLKTTTYHFAGTISSQIRKSTSITSPTLSSCGTVTFYGYNGTFTASYNGSSITLTTSSVNGADGYTWTKYTGTVNSGVAATLTITAGSSAVGYLDEISVTSFTACTAPTIQTSTMTTSSTTSTSTNYAFTRGNGTGGVLVVARISGTAAVAPTSGTSYTANSIFGSGNTTGTGNYVVYNGAAAGINTATGNLSITGLSANNYILTAYEYNTVSTCYNTTSPATASITNYSLPFSETFSGGALPTSWSNPIVTTGTNQPALTFPTQASTTFPTVTSIPNSSTNCVQFNSFSASYGSQIRLQTPILNTSSSTGGTMLLTFQWCTDNGYSTNNDNVQVQYSTNGGSTWTNVGTSIARYNATALATGTWITQTIMIPSNSSTLQIGFLLTSATGNNCHLANVSIAVPAPPTITDFNSVNSACVGGNITINGTNFSGVTAANITIGGTAVSSITSNTSNQIVAVVGSGTTGYVSVTAAGGTVSSSGGAGTFTVLPPLSGLTYTTSTVTYCTGSAITPNNASLSTGGGTITYSVSPTLPTGININANTGQITGTPTAVVAATNYTITATNGACSTTCVINITTVISLSALTYSTPTATYCTSFAITNNTVTITGGGTITYSISPTLPTGLTISSTTGAISGTPTLVSTATNYTVTATNGACSTTATVNIATPSGLSGLSYTLTTAIYCVGYAITANSATITGTPTSYSVSPALPGGLSLNTTTGQITGTPTTLTITANYTVTATNGSCTTTKVLTISVYGPLSGSYNVGVGQTFPTLTAAVTAYNNSCNTMAGPVTFLLRDTAYSTNETFPITINANSGASATNTLTIRPYTGVTSIIYGYPALSVIKLNGAKYVTIDGSNSGGIDKSLTIKNTGVASPTVISLVSLGTNTGASNNTIKNCNISINPGALNNNNPGYGIAIGGSVPGTAGADNDNNTIQNNYISVAPICIYAYGTASVSSGGDDNLTITGNTINTITSNLQSYGIQVGNALNSTISQNTIAVQTSGAYTPVGISLETGFVSSTVTANKITNVSTTATGGYGGRGITIGTGTATSTLTIANNFISGVNGSNFSTFSSSSAMGIAIGMIGGSATITTIAGGINLYYNTVNMYGTYNYGANCITTALYIGTGASALNIKDNILVNTMNNTNTGYASKAYAIYSAAANTAFTSIDYNDYVASGATTANTDFLGYITSDRASLTDVVTGFGSNANSKNIAPVFNTNSDLHLSYYMNTTLDNKGVAISGITTDIDGETRTGYDIGADEFSQPSPVISSSSTGSNTYGTAGSYSITASNFPTSYNATYNGGALPSGMSVNTSTGAITIGATTSAASYSILISATNNTGTGSATLTYTVNAATLTVTASAQIKTYGVTSPTTGSLNTNYSVIGLKNSDSVNSVTLGYNGTPTGNLATATVGNYTITPSAVIFSTGLITNYNISYQTNTLTINAANLTITANVQSKVYGTTQITPVLGSSAFIPSGLQNGETIGSVTLTYGAGGLTATSITGSTSSITPSAATGGTFTAGNYNITYTPGTLTVAQAVLTVTASDQNKYYGSTSATSGTLNTDYTVSGLQNSDAVNGVTFSYTGTLSGDQATATVGSYIITPSGLTLSSGYISNYSILYHTGALIINAKSLIVTANNISKIEGDVLTNPITGSTEFTSSGLQNGENIGSVTITYGSSASADATSGIYLADATPTAATGGTFTASNYSISYVAGNVTVASVSSPSCPLSNSVSPASDQTICQSASAIMLKDTITTSGTVGTPTFSYQWYYNTTNSNTVLGATIINGATSNTYTPLTSGDEVGTRYYFCVGYATDNTCGQDSSTQSLASNTVKVTVNATPSIPIGSTFQSFCSASSPTIANLAATGLSIKWYDAASNGTLLLSSTPLSSNHFYASQTISGCESSSRLDVTTIINTNPESPSGLSSQAFCSSASPSIANLTATGSSIQWYSSSTGGNLLTSDLTLTNGTHYYASQTTSGCESTSRFDVTTTVNTTPGAPIGTASQSFCSGNSPTVANLSATGSALKWYDAASNGTLLSSDTALTTATHFYASQTTSGCESISRFDVTAIINATPDAPTGSTSQTFCSAANPSIANLTITGSGIKWYNTASNGTLQTSGTTLSSTDYFASQTVNGCESSSRFDVSIIINTTPTAPTGIAAQTFCNGTTIASLAATGSNILWYATSIGGSSLTTSSALVTGNHYYASQTINGCESTSRLDVTATLVAPPIINTPTATPSIVCNGGASTIATITDATFNIGQVSDASSNLYNMIGYGMYFSTVSAATINSIDIYPSDIGTLTIQLLNTGGTLQASQSFTIAPGDISTTVKKTLVLNFNIPANSTGWQLFYSSIDIYRGAASYTYPQASNNFSITGNTLDGNNILSGTRWYFYNWNVTLFSVGMGSLTWNWNPGNLSGNSVTVHPTSTTTYTVTASNGNCSSTGTVTVSVAPVSCGALTTGGTSCAGLHTVTTNPSGGSLPYSYSWTEDGYAFGGNTSTITASVGMHTYTCTITDACSNNCSSSLSVTSNPLPTVNVSPNTATYCTPGSSVAITASGASTYMWTPATGLSATTGSSVNASPTNVTTYTVTGTDANGCINTASTVINTSSIPTSVTASASNNNICFGNTINLTSSAISNVNSAFLSPTGDGGLETGNTLALNNWTVINGSYNIWSVGTAAGTQTGSNAAYTGTNFVGTANASYNHFYRDIVIPANATNIKLQFYLKWPTIDNGYDSLNVYTSPTSFTPVNTATPSTLTATRVFSNTSTAYSSFTLQTVTLSNSLAGTTIRLIFTYRCDGVTPITVGAIDNISLTADIPSSLTYAWLSSPAGYASFIQNPTGVSPTTSTQYIVTATNSYGCSASNTTSTVTVNTIPTTPTVSNNGPVCAGSSLNLTTPTVTGASYSWTGPNGFTSTSQNPIVSTNATVSMSGSYSVIVTVNACTSAVGTTSVTVNPLPTTPTATNNGPICAGSTLSLTTPTVTGASYSWTGPNGFTSSSQNPTVSINATANMSGTYYVTTTVNGCTSATGTTSATVNAIPVTPTVSNNGPICAGSTLSLISNALGTISWTGPNGFTSSSQNPGITNSTTAYNGTYSVTSTVNGCISAAGTTNAVVNGIPATPTVSNNGPICVGSTLNLFSNAIGTISWTGSNGFTSSSQNPDITNSTTAYNGTYSVTSTVNGCTSATGTTNATVYTIPVTPIVSNNGPICAGSTLNFYSNATGTISWTGPNGFTSSSQNPNITNTTTAYNGTYSVTSTVNGCISAAGTTNATVNAIPSTPIASNNGPICADSTLNLFSNATGTISWTGPNGFSSSSQNPGINNSTTAYNGTYSVTSTDNGCISAAGTTNAVVNGIPATPTVSNNGPICVGSTLNLFSNAIGTISWTGSNGFTSSSQNPDITNSTTAYNGTYSVTSTVNGCTSATGTTNATVNAIPSTPIVSNNGPICAGSTLNLTSNALGTISWTGPNGFTSSYQNLSINNTTTAYNGTYSVTSTVNGCTSAAGTTSATVNAIPSAPTAVNCWDNYQWDTTSCAWVNIGTSAPIGTAPTTVNCWDNYQWDTTYCAWINLGTSTPQGNAPIAVNCWDNYQWDTTSCNWINIGTSTPQGNAPIAVNCWDNYKWDTTSCAWVNIGSSAPTGNAPTAVHCWDNYQWDTTSCNWVNIGIQQPTPNAGSNGTLTLCAGTTPTIDQLFAALNGTPDTNGTWSNSGLVYTYTVSGGVCPNATANVLVIVNTPSVGGNALASNPIICYNDSTSITLTAYNGNIQWQQSANGLDWSNVTNGIGATTDTYTTPNLTAITYYRAIVTSGVCSSDSSNTVNVSFPFPVAQPTDLILTAGTNSITGTFTASASADHYLIIRSTADNLTAIPQNGTTYNTYDQIGGGTIVSYQTDLGFSDTGLVMNTEYYYFVFAANNLTCNNGPVYLALAPLIGNTITSLPPTSNKTLNIIAMFQEYYNTSTGLMHQTKGINWDTGDLYNNFCSTIVDTVKVVIRKTNVTDPNNPCTIDTVFYGVNLNNNGLITISLSAGITGYHYIEIKHRNSIETWSDSVNFSTDTIKYDFYNHISQFALDNGMLQDGTHAWIWGGDVNQNGNLESEDATSIYVAANSDDPTVNNGYVICDIDGNGNLDSQDYGLAYNNANLGANIITPFSYMKKK